ncbi:MAG: hypothetical protein VB997_06905, partial [Opitutales bacterium]
MKTKRNLSLAFLLILGGSLAGQESPAPFQPIDEVLKGVDKLIEGFGASPLTTPALPAIPAVQPSPAVPIPEVVPFPQAVAPRPLPTDPDAGSLRYDQVLKP